MVELALHASICGVRVSDEPGVARVESEAFDEFNFVVATDAVVAHALQTETQVPVWFEGCCADLGSHGGSACAQFVGMSATAKVGLGQMLPAYEWIPCHLSRPEIQTSIVLQAKRYTGPELEARQCLASPNKFRSWIIKLSSEPIATVSVFVTEAGEAGLFDLWVAPHMRGCGIGAAIADKAMGQAFGMGAKRCVVQAVPKAVPLFEGIGFRRTCDLAMRLR